MLQCEKIVFVRGSCSKYLKRLILSKLYSAATTVAVCCCLLLAKIDFLAYRKPDPPTLQEVLPPPVCSTWYFYGKYRSRTVIQWMIDSIR